MPSPSKEENILRIIIENSPLKQWHFEQIAKEANVTRAVASKWLKKYIREGIITREKPKGKFPFFYAGEKNARYTSFKRIYALQKLHESGLIGDIASDPGVKTAILFGSMAKGDWYRESDIDIFILGKITNFDKEAYQIALHHEIELHIFKDENELKQIKTGLLSSVANGYAIKGQVKDILK